MNKRNKIIAMTILVSSMMSQAMSVRDRARMFEQGAANNASIERAVRPVEVGRGKVAALAKAFDERALAGQSGEDLVKAMKKAREEQKVEEVILQDALKKFDIDKPGLEGRTALAWAAYRGEFLEVAALLMAGANVNSVADNGFTPLLCAATNFGSASLYNNVDKIVRQFQIIQGLIDSGADVNASLFDGKGASALNFVSGAIGYNADAGIWIEYVNSLINKLLQKGADVNHINTFMHETPLDAALEHSPQIANLLRGAGGKTYAELMGMNEDMPLENDAY